MLKFAFAAAVAGLFTITPVFAQEMMKCDEANMMKTQMEMAMGEMTMAKDAMKASDMAKCETHLNKAAMELKAK